MRKKSLLILVGVLLLAPVVGLAEEIELAYDDGAPLGGLAPPRDDYIFAVNFTPPAGEWLLKTIRYFIVTPRGPVGVRVYEDVGEPGTDLVEMFEVEPGAPGWFDVDMREHLITVNEDFFVGYDFLSTDNNPALGGDQEGNGRSWIYTPGTDWIEEEYTTYFIRAVITDEVGVDEGLSTELLVEIHHLPTIITGFTRIEYSLTRPGREELTLWDSSGRQVRTLSEGYRTAGHHTVEYDGCNTSGHALPRGVYFLRLKVEGVTLTRKVVVVY